MFAFSFIRSGWEIKADKNFLKLYDFILLNSVTDGGNKKIIIIDCGDSFDPYRLADLVKNTALKQAGSGGRRGYRTAAGRILDNIIISRMFTAHQLKSKLSMLLNGVADGFIGHIGDIGDIILIIHNIDRLIYDYYATAESSSYVVNDGVIEDIARLIRGFSCPAVLTTQDNFFTNFIK